MDNTITQEEFSAILLKLCEPFDLSELEFRPMTVTKDKKRAQAAVYADPRSYMARLDEVCPGWESTFTTWGNERIICHLTIAGVTRSSTGEMDKQSLSQEIGGTAAEAQALKRAATQFGLGRYLYDVKGMWADYDDAGRKFSPHGIAELRKRMNEITKALRSNPTKPIVVDDGEDDSAADSAPVKKSAAAAGAKKPAATSPQQRNGNANDNKPLETAPAQQAAADDQPFSLTQEQAATFQADVKAICGDKSANLLTEACKTLNFSKFSEVNQEQWDILCFWLEQMEEQEKPFRLSANAIAYAKTELAKQQGELVE